MMKRIFAVQVSDTTMLNLYSAACTQIVFILRHTHHSRFHLCKMLMEIRYCFNALIKIGDIKFFIGAVQVIAV